MNSAQLRRAFEEETARHLAAARELLASDGELSREDIAEVFRRVHSVKGIAASVGEDGLAACAHQVEDLLAQARDSEAELSPTDRRALRRELERCQTFLRDAPSADATPGLQGDRLPPVRVPEDKLDQLLDLVLGLSAAQQRLEHRLGLPDDSELLALRDAITGGVRQLSREILELRLLPVRALLPLLEEAVRDWARERGVRVQISVRGDAVRGDRRILERLLGPLGHVLRNAIVHGIEPPSERRAAGKAEIGTIRITIHRDREQLLLRVADDGRGARADEIVSRAVARGVLARAPGRPMPLQAALDLLTRPGMSRLVTADALAGRGMGLSAVRAELERLGGQFRLRPGRGPGLSAEMRVPLGVAVVDLFLVDAGGQTFAIPVGSVREVRGAEPPVGPRGERPRRVLDLAAVLGAGPEPGPGEASSARNAPLLVIERPGPATALAVSRIRARAELVVRPLGDPLDAIPPWSGAALLPSGGLALVVDPLRITPRARAVSEPAEPARIGG